MNEAQFNRFSGLAAAAYAKTGNPEKIDPATIIAIIMAIVQALGGVCPKPPTAASLKEACASPPPFARLLVRIETRSQLGVGQFRHAGQDVIDSIFSLGAGNDEATLAEFLGCCG